MTTPLHPDAEKKIEEIARAESSTRSALKVLAEYLRALVCNKCGVELESNGYHPPNSVDVCIVAPWKPITRAEWQSRQRRNP